MFRIKRIGFTNLALAAVFSFLGVNQAYSQTSETRTILRDLQVSGIPKLKIDLSNAATEKYAIVIGNGDYENAPDLPNAISDAKLIASVLEQSDYIVEAFYNLDKRGFERAFRRFLFDVNKGSDVIIFYAGHGVQVGKSNRLLPIDADIDTVYDLPFETVSLSSMLSLAGSRARSLVTILDSCRDNPFPDQSVIGGLDAVPDNLRSGFTPQDSPVNSLLVFSTAPGAVALDGQGNNSPFTLNFVESLQDLTDEPLQAVLRETRRRVFDETQGQQVPWESSSLVESLFLNPVGDIEPDQNPTQDEQTDNVITLKTELNTVVDLGRSITDAIGKAEFSNFSLVQEPNRGRLNLPLEARTRGLSIANLTANSLRNLTYRFTDPEPSALSIQDGTLSDEFKLRIDGELYKIQMTMGVNQCDYYAGDYLDPEGSGVARYPNEIEPEAALLACKESILLDPDVGRFHYQAGRAHLALKNLEAAQVAFEIARDLGHTRAWHGLGLLELARQVEQSVPQSVVAGDKARSLLLRGVDRGDPYAIHTLGLQLLKHGQSTTEKRQGFQLLSRSQELGHTFSMNALGLYFLDKESANYDPIRGLRYLKESAARGDIYGFNNMGYVAQNGIADEKLDLNVAMQWYKKASAGGHPSAPSNIGRVYASGAPGFAANPVEAVKWYDIGLERGDAWGGANGAWLIANRKAKGFGLGAAAKRAAMAITLNNPDARNAAQNVLNNLSEKELNAGVQKLLVELGEQLSVDGDFGQKSASSLRNVLKGNELEFIPIREEQLISLAKLVWKKNPFRVDLY